MQCATISKRVSRKSGSNLYSVERQEERERDDYGDAAAREHCRCPAPYAAFDPHPHLRRL